MVLYSAAASDITCRLRASYVDVILNQTIATVDSINASTSGGTTQTIHDIGKIEIGLGEQLGMAVQLFSMVATAFIISMIQQVSWLR
jgi:hypothetical protein